MARKLRNFIWDLAQRKTDEGEFNPYNSIFKDQDLPTGPGIRQQNLRIYLNYHLRNKSNVLWLFDHPGFLDSVRTGVPLLNEENYENIKNYLKIKGNFETATKFSSRVDKSPISKIVWKSTSNLNKKPIFWNIYPFYKHDKSIETVISPKKKDIIKHSEILENFIKLVKPRKIFVFGREAQKYANYLNLKYKYVDHPVKIGYDTFQKNIKNYS